MLTVSSESSPQLCCLATHWLFFPSLLKGRYDIFIQWRTGKILQVSGKKTKEMLVDFSMDGIIVSPSKIDDEKAEQVITHKSLVIEIDKELRFNHCAESKCRRLQQRMFFPQKTECFQIILYFTKLCFISLAYLHFGK